MLVRGVGVLVVAAVVALSASCSPSAPGPPPPYRQAGSWSWVPVGTAQPEPVAMVGSIRRVRLGNGLWEATGWSQDTAGRQASPALWVSSDGASWQPVGVPSTGASTGMTTSITDDGQQGLLGGFTGTGPTARPTVWRSLDGWRWEDPVALPLPESATGATVTGLAQGGPGWIAVGGPVPGGNAPSLIWSSPDGRSWNLTDRPSPDAAPVTFDAVATRGSTVVAVGVDASGTVVAARSEGSGPWSSVPVGTGARRPGGQVGNSAPSGSSGTSGPLGDETATGRAWLPLTVSSDRFVTAVRADSRADAGVMIMSSADGLTWVEGPVVPGGEAADQVRLGDRAGHLRVAVSSAWPTATLGLAEWDGNRWLRVPGPVLADDETTTAGPVIAGISGGGWVVLGPRPLGDIGRSSWRSVDDGWLAGDARRVPPAERRQGDQVLAATARPDVAVAVGSSEVIGLGGAGTGAPTGSRAEGRLWTSSDSVGWTEVPVTSASEALRAVAVDENGGVLAAGSLRPEKGGGPLWLYAADGRTFERRGAFGPGAAPGGLEPAALVRSAGRWVAAGRLRASTTEDGRAAVWSSPDGGQWSPWPVPASTGTLVGACAHGDDIWVVGAGGDPSARRLEDHPTAMAAGTEGQNALVWHSRRGDPFTAMPLDPEVSSRWRPTGCSAAEGRLAVVGRVGATESDTSGRFDALMVEWDVDGTMSLRPGPSVASLAAVAPDGDSWIVVGQLASSASWPSAGGGAVWRVDRAGRWSLDPDVASMVTGPPPGHLVTAWSVAGKFAGPGTSTMIVGGAIGDGGLVLIRRG